MVKSYRLIRKANDDLFNIMSWYLEQSPGVEDLFLREFERSLKKIIRNPEAYKLVDRKTRRYSMKTFRYTIYYGIRNEIIVARIRSNHQRPLKRYY